MNSIRRELIKEMVRREGVVTIDALRDAFPDVSLMTIHRDLSYLQERGDLTKIRGGARASEATHSEGARWERSEFEPAFHERERINPEAKRAIAKKAAPLTDGASTVFLDSGTTMLALARALPDFRASFITASPNIALELAKRPKFTVGLCGGSLNKSNLALSGSPALEYLSGINIQMAFIAPTGYAAECGFTCGVESEAKVKELVIAKARTCVAVMDRSKLGRVLPHTFATLGDFATLVTDTSPASLPEALRQAASEAGTTLL